MVHAPLLQAYRRFSRFFFSRDIHSHMSWNGLVPVVVCYGCLLVFLFFPPETSASIYEASFIVSDFGATDGAHNRYWRGYRFRVKEKTTVTALRGGADSDNYQIAIFPLTGWGNQELQHPEIVVQAPSERGGTVPLDSPITLSPDTYYYLAQGATHASGSQYRVGSYSVEALKDSFWCIDNWEPTDGENSLIVSTNGEAENRAGDSIDSTHASKPDIGFIGECYLCPAGEIPSDDQDECVKCENYEIAKETDNECSPCPAGAIPSADQNECVQCKMYEIAKVTDDECSPCPAGEIPNDHNDECRKCEDHEIATEADLECSPCPAGEIPNDVPSGDQGGCMPCKVYEFSTTQDVNCAVCPNGTVPSDDQGGCIPCKAYEIATPYDEECKVCPNGTIPDGAKSTCKLCTPGKYALKSYTQCEECVPGYYNEYEGSSFCTPCEKHSYQHRSGQTRCHRCSTGWYQFQSGQTKCIHWKEVKGLLPPQRPKRYVI